MSNAPPGGFNITRTATAVAPVGNTPRGPANGGEVVTRERRISGPTTYDSDSGLVKPIEGGWTGKDGAVPVEKPAADPAVKPAPSRQEAWRTLEAAKKAEREANKSKGQEKRQVLAKDFLKKGDLVGAAKAMGMSPAEFREYAQNALLTVPTPDKPKTPEEERAAADEAFRAEVKKEREENARFRDGVVKTTYIKDKIAPVLADKEKYEFCAQEKGIESYIYDFMNAHYTKTGEELSAADVAETVEAELEKAFIAKFEAHKGMKKVAKLLAPPPEPTEETRDLDVSAPEVEEEVLGAQGEEEVNEAPPPPPRKAVIRQQPTNGNAPRTSFALLSREERMRIMDEERRAERQ